MSYGSLRIVYDVCRRRHPDMTVQCGFKEEKHAKEMMHLLQTLEPPENKDEIALTFSLKLNDGFYVMHGWYILQRFQYEGGDWTKWRLTSGSDISRRYRRREDAAEHCMEQPALQDIDAVNIEIKRCVVTVYVGTMRVHSLTVCSAESLDKGAKRAAAAAAAYAKSGGTGKKYTLEVDSPWGMEGTVCDSVYCLFVVVINHFAFCHLLT